MPTLTFLYVRKIHREYRIIKALVLSDPIISAAITCLSPVQIEGRGINPRFYSISFLRPKLSRHESNNIAYDCSNERHVRDLRSMKSTFWKGLAAEYKHY